MDRARSDLACAACVSMSPVDERANRPSDHLMMSSRSISLNSRELGALICSLIPRENGMPCLYVYLHEERDSTRDAESTSFRVKDVYRYRVTLVRRKTAFLPETADPTLGKVQKSSVTVTVKFLRDAFGLMITFLRSFQFENP